MEGLFSTLASGASASISLKTAPHPHPPLGRGAPADPHLSGLFLMPQLGVPLAISGLALGWGLWGGGQGPPAWQI